MSLKCVADKVKPRDEAKIVLMNDTHELDSTKHKPSNNKNQVYQITDYRYPTFTRYDNLENWLYCIVTWRGQEFIAHLQEPLEVPCKYYTFLSFMKSIKQQPVDGERSQTSCGIGCFQLIKDN